MKLMKTKPDDLLFGMKDVRHPFEDYCLSDAMKVARGIASLNDLEVNSAQQARELIKKSMASAGHLWITGMAALDVMDAAIDGRDLLKSNRFN